MTEIEQAYKTLGLNTGASLRQVDEAYHDLRALWDPKRLTDNLRLRAQAGEKKKEIEGAYETIIEHLSRISGQKSDRSRSVEHSPVPATNSDTNRPSANLFDDAFSDRIAQGKRRIPVWAILFLIVLAGLFLSYLALSPSRERTEAIRATAQDEEESELARVVEEVRGRYTKGNTATHLADTPEPTAKTVPVPEVKPTPIAPEPSPKTVKPEKPRQVPPPRQEAVPQKKASREPQPPSKPETEPERVERSPSDKPLLVRSEIQPADEDASEKLADGPSEEQLDIFKTLLKGSATASKLVKGEIGTLTFAEWSVIQQTPSETWIDLVATWTSGQEVHFFWSVNPGTGGVRPLNQAARNLESSVSSP